MKLVVIEGPGKLGTLKKYLGSDYDVVATKGHIRDLPNKDLAVDINKNFEPHYENMPDKKDVIADLKKRASKADAIYLATDPDREGEAISWHIAHILGLKPNTKCRIKFNEISKNAVQEALKHPEAIDQNLVDAQQARRVLDRLVGYKLSPIICKAIKPKLSAGRVQSIALKLVVDREREIRDFKPEEYWTVVSELEKQKSKFKASLASFKEEKIRPKNKEEVDHILSELNGKDFVVSKIKKSKLKSNPLPPFITSTMIQDALNKLGMDSAKTSRSAQHLYEGVELAGEGKVALITYIRTDSTRVSAEAMSAARSYVAKTYGSEYVPEKPNVYTKKGNAQDAHEAIRPISLERTPASVKASLSPENYKLYKLIYERFLASQMSSAIYDSVNVDIKAGDYGFKATGKTVDFDGYTVIYKEYTGEEKEADAKLPKLEEGEKLNLIDIKTEQKFTKPPARYTEASLVKAMEEKGIGRPATYAAILSTITYREYVKKEGKSFVPTELGEAVSDYLEKYFKGVINVKFTANMESRLDDIAEKGEKWQDVVGSFWNGFKELLYSADKRSVGYKAPAVETDVVCDKCGHKMVLREGRYGKFLGCSNFPNCKNIMPYKNETSETGVCPECGKEVVARKSKKGKVFYSCSGYPDCKFMSWDIPVAEKCPKCGSYLLKKPGKNSYKCSSCDYKREEDGKES